MCEEERRLNTQDKKTWELWVPDRTDRSELTGNYRRLSNIPKHSTEASTLRGLWVWCLRSEKTWADENFETEGDGNLEKIIEEERRVKMQDKKTWELWVPNRTDWSELTGNYRRLSKIPKHSTDALTLSGLWVWRILKLWEDHDEGCDPKRTLSLMCEKRKDVWRRRTWRCENQGRVV